MLIITTMDLPDDDPIFSQTYEREQLEARKKFIIERDNLINTCQNVKFIQKKSLKLIHERDTKYELIG
jgi:hypothetical protein